jgi:hypothetical protein
MITGYPLTGEAGFSAPCGPDQTARNSLAGAAPETRSGLACFAGEPAAAHRDRLRLNCVQTGHRTRLPARQPFPICAPDLTRAALYTQEVLKAIAFLF